MAVISIIGAPGTGKSFLTKQLGCLDCMPSFFEGEMGIFTEEILRLLNGEVDRANRYDWLCNHLQKNLENASKIASIGLDCYVDGDVTSVEAWLEAETGTKSPSFLKKWINDNKKLMADKVLFLRIPEKEIIEQLKRRARGAEMTDFIFKRAIRIQKGCEKIALRYNHIKVIDRKDLDFKQENDLLKIKELIRQIRPNES